MLVDNRLLKHFIINKNGCAKNHRHQQPQHQHILISPGVRRAAIQVCTIQYHIHGVVGAALLCRVITIVVQWVPATCTCTSGPKHFEWSLRGLLFGLAL